MSHTRAEKIIKKDETLDQRYDVLNELGRGRFAVVKKCVCKETGQSYAAKIIKKSRTGNQGRSGREQLLLEIDILNESTHPKMVRLYDVFETRTEMQLILEFAAGGDLHHHCIEADVVRTEKEICYLIRQIVEAVKYLHDLKIVHLDLKPDNILLKASGGIFPEIRLIDFGLSRRLDLPYSQFDIVGTPEYVAPEVLSYEPIDFGSDMWSIGVVTYVLLSGISPFAGDDVMETYSNIGMVDYDFDCEEFDDVSEAAMNFIELLLERSPKKRMSAREALEHEWLKQLEQGLTAEDVVEAQHLQTQQAGEEKKQIVQQDDDEVNGRVSSDEENKDSHEDCFRESPTPPSNDVPVEPINDESHTSQKTDSAREYLQSVDNVSKETPTCDDVEKVESSIKKYSRKTPSPVDDSTAQSPSPADDSTAQTPAPVDDSTAQTPSPVDNSTAQTPAPVDDSAAQIPTHVDDSAAHDTTPVDDSTAQIPTPADGSAPQIPLYVDDSGAQDPTPVDSAAETSTSFNDTSEQLPVIVDAEQKIEEEKKVDIKKSKKEVDVQKETVDKPVEVKKEVCPDRKGSKHEVKKMSMDNVPFKLAPEKTETSVKSNTTAKPLPSKLTSKFLQQKSESSIASKQSPVFARRVDASKFESKSATNIRSKSPLCDDVTPSGSLGKLNDSFDRSSPRSSFAKLPGAEGDNERKSSDSSTRSKSPNDELGPQKMTRNMSCQKIPGGIAAKMANKFSSGSPTNSATNISVKLPGKLNSKFNPPKSVERKQSPPDVKKANGGEKSSPKLTSKFEEPVKKTEARTPSPDVAPPVVTPGPVVVPSIVEVNKPLQTSAPEVNTTPKSFTVQPTKKVLDEPAPVENEKHFKDVNGTHEDENSAPSPAIRKLVIGPMVSCSAIQDPKAPNTFKTTMRSGGAIKMNLGTQMMAQKKETNVEESAHAPKLKDSRDKSKSISRRRNADNSPTGQRKNYRRLYVSKSRNSRAFEHDFSVNNEAAQIMQRVENDVLKIEFRLKSTDLKLLP